MQNFTIAGLKGAGQILVVEDLTAGDRELLQMVLEPGGSLWKIVRAMVDYQGALKEALASADLDDPATLLSVRQVQSNIKSIQWLVDTIEAAVQIPGAKQS